jgi:uroporphyrinogen-III synthase
MRKEPTQAERVLWEELRNNRLNGAKFRRQHPLVGFILDFYCDKFKLCIEVDGGIHLETEQSEYDKSRDEYLKEFGVQTIRFTNDEVERDMERVLEVIRGHLH